MQRNISFFAWVVAVLAVLSFAGVVYFARDIALRAQARTLELSDAQWTVTRDASAQRTHVLVSETVEERAALASLFAEDVVSAANMVRAAGEASGVSLQLGNILSDTSADVSVGAVEVVGFSIQADGSFAELMHLLELLEVFPVPASLERFDLSRSPSLGEDASWHGSLYLRVFIGKPTATI